MLKIKDSLFNEDEIKYIKPDYYQNQHKPYVIHIRFKDDVYLDIHFSTQVEIFDELLEENAKLKRELEDMTDCRDIASGHRKEVQDRETRLLNQQKEFIKYLEDEIEIGTFPKCVHNTILQKYKEIVGVINE